MLTKNIENIRCDIRKDLGRYNFASNEKDWCVQMLLPDGKWISATWPQDDEPATDDEAPTEVLAIIEARIKSYWIMPSRPELLARIEAARPLLPKMDDAWARSHISALRNCISRFETFLIDDQEQA